ncbi:hypothetical protein Tco_0533424 [Tanacetum coccineum]
MSHPHPKRNFVPRAVLTKSSLKTLNTARQNSLRAEVSVNTARPTNIAYTRPTVNCARPVSNVFNRAHSHVRRPFNKFTTNEYSNFNEKVNSVKGNVTTFGPKAVVSNNKGNKANVVKASACWVWRPKQKVLDNGNPQLELQEKGVIDSGCSRHMTENKSYLSDYEEIDGGFVAFGGNSKGGKITGKGKFDGKADEGFFVGYSVNSRAFGVFNSRTRIIEETLHITFLENKPNVAGSGPEWLFDIDTLTKSMNYKPVVTGNRSNGSAGTKACDNAGKARVETVPGKDYILEEEKNDAKVPKKESGVSSKEDDQDDQDLRDEFERFIHQEKDENINIYGCEDDPNMPNLEEIVYSDDDEDVGAEADMTNLDTHIHVIQSFDNPSRIKAADELLQFKLQKFDFGDLPYCKEAKGQNGSTKTRKMRDGIVVRNKASWKSMCGQPPGLEDPSYLTEFIKGKKALYGLHQAPRAWCYLDRLMIGMSWEYYLDKIGVYTGNSRVSAADITKCCWAKKDNANFAEIVDFLNASSIRYALIVSPTIYVSYIEQFWSTEKIKIVNNETQIRAKVDDKTIHEERGDSMERAVTIATSLDVDPRRQDTILGDRPAQTRFERLSKQSNNPPLSRVNTLVSGEDSMILQELMYLCTKLSERVLALENIKTAQDLEITNLKKRVKNLEKKKKSRTPQLKRRLFKIPAKDKGKGIMQEPEKPMKVKGKDQIEYDADVAHKLQAEYVKICDADYKLATKLLAEEQGEISIEERSRLFVELIDKRKKHFAKLRAEEQRRKPPTKTQKRNIMSTYLKNMDGYKHTQLKNKRFEEIQMLFV